MAIAHLLHKSQTSYLDYSSRTIFINCHLSILYMHILYMHMVCHQVAVVFKVCFEYFSCGQMLV